MLNARNGGSITPRFYKQLQTHVANDRLSIHPQTHISQQCWDPERLIWQVQTDPPFPALPSQFDYIYYATGVKPDIESLSLMAPIRERYPIDSIGGYPCLTNDLTWREDVPLFIAGRLAGLRIGPDSNNLEGARTGAERISWGVQEVLEREGREGTGSSWGLDCEMCQEIGALNMYECLDSSGQE